MYKLDELYMNLSIPCFKAKACNQYKEIYGVILHFYVVYTLTSVNNPKHPKLILYIILLLQMSFFSL